jgi:hypothetical protein
MSESAAVSKPKQLEKKIESRWRRLSRRVQWTIITMVVLLVALRLALPYIIKDYVNKQLHKLPEYTGEVGGIDVHLWRGAYQIRNIKIMKTGGKVPTPFFSSPLIDLAVQWREIFHGKIAGKILVDQPSLNFVTGPTTNQSQLGEGQPWEKTVASFYPFDINQFQIRRGNVRFQDFYKEKPVDIYLTNLDLVATNLTNNRHPNEKLPAGITAKAGTLGNGEFVLKVKLNPIADSPTYELDAVLTNVDMVALNNFLEAYAKVDVEKGAFSLYTSVASADDNYQGFIKVLFKNLQVFAWEKEKKKNVLEIFWEAIVGTLTAGFKNHPHDQLATQIPISGSYNKSHIGVMPAVGNLLRNAFIRALVPGIGKPIKVQQVEKQAAENPSSPPPPAKPASR